MKKRMGTLALAVCFGASMMAGCQNESSDNTKSVSDSSEAKTESQTESQSGEENLFANSTGNFMEDGKFKVVFVCAAMSDAYNYLLNQTVIEVFENNAPDWIVLENLDMQGDQLKQAEIYEQILMEGDCGVLSSATLVDCSDYFQQLTDAGVSVLNQGITVQEVVDAGCCAIQMANTYDQGYVNGQYAVEKLPEGAKGCILEGKAGQEDSVKRYNGITDALSERDDIEVLSVQNADWSRDTAYTVVTDWLTAYGQFDFIICENDAMALGAVEAIQAAGMDPSDFFISGIDSLYDGSSAIAAGTMTCSAQMDTYEYANYLLQYAIDVATGERAYDDYDYVEFEPTLITAENAQELVDFYVSKGLDQ